MTTDLRPVAAPDASADAAAINPETRSWLRIAACCLLLIGLAMVQSPGLQIADTKFDLVVDPTAFLGRATHLWDPSGAFGQLQNQAYGYLWPMGPFFALLGSLGLPGWVVQRLWQGLLLSVAFTGAARVSRALGIRSDLACLLAGFAFALSPRIVSIVGSVSIEAWPSAVAPWVLLPLVVGAERGSPRRAALLSGLAVAMVGGVNAVATFAVIPTAAIWLLTRAPGPRRRSMMLWWPIFTLIGTLWWLVPLFVMGAYSPPFLDYIETASVTTFPTTLFDSLRGTSDWVPYIDPAWQGGNRLVREGWLPLNSGLVLMLGLMGISLRGNPHRAFLVLSTVTGLVLVTMGHLGEVQGWFAGGLHSSLDGALAPVRNVHKFDPIIRLPMVIGLAWLLQSVSDSAERSTLSLRGVRIRWASHAPIVGIAVIGLVGSMTPALVGQLANTDATQGTPDYWREAVGWLDEQNPGDGSSLDGGVALLAPGSGFADYRWGSPRDEPVQYLGADSWAVRNAVPLAPPGNIRMLDAFEDRMAQGRGSAGLSTYLRRGGVQFLVVRNDLAPSADIPESVLVHQAVDNSPGLSLVKTFGPEVGGGGGNLETDTGRIVVNGGWQLTTPAIEVYAVDGGDQAAVAADVLPVVAGGPEDLLDLSDENLIDDAPTRLAADLEDDELAAPLDVPWVLTDGYAERERFVGKVHDATSPVIAPGDRSHSGNPTRDYLISDDDRWATSADYDGAKSVSASTSMSDSNAIGGSRPGNHPYAALDGDSETAWLSGNDGADPPWWRVDLEDPTDLRQVTVTLGEGLAPSEDLVVVTEAGTTSPFDIDAGESRTVTLPQGETSWVRIERPDGSTRQLTLAEVDLGFPVTRRLVLPTVPSAWAPPDAIVLRRLLDARQGCAEVGSAIRCQAGRERPAEEPAGFRREITLPASRDYPVRLTASARPSAELLRALQARLPINATASSRAVPDVRSDGFSAIDGDPTTTWSAGPTDDRPVLSLNWIGRTTISGIRLVTDPDTAARTPTSVTLTWPKGSRKVSLDAEGRATFAPFVADSLQVRVDAAGNAASVDSQGVATGSPIGISELRLRGLDLAPTTLSRQVRTWRCGSGPTIGVDGATLRTALVASEFQLWAGDRVPTEICDSAATTLELTTGTTSVSVEPSGIAVPDTLVLGDLSEVPASAQVAEVDGTGPTAATVAPDGDQGWVVQRRNVNPGWQADADGARGDPVTIDGWQQGWRTDGESLQTRFAPDTAYRTGLIGGLVLLVLLAAAAALPRRRWPGQDLRMSRAREFSPVVAWLAAPVVGGLLAGWPGAVLALVGAVVLPQVERRSVEAATWLVGVLVLVASLAYFARPWGNSDGWAGTSSWPHYLVVVALGAAVGLAAERRPRLRSRWLGSSTNR